MKIAIVDDEETICRSLVRLLESAGLSVTAFQSAEAFLASPIRNSFGCAVLDIHIGSGMSGLQLRQLMLDEGDPTRVIFLTGYDEPPLRAKAARLGCEALLRKGEDPMALVELLRKLDR